MSTINKYILNLTTWTVVAYFQATRGLELHLEERKSFINTSNLSF